MYTGKYLNIVLTIIMDRVFCFYCQTRIKQGEISPYVSIPIRREGSILSQCERCGMNVDYGVHEYSISHFGDRVLCLSCQNAIKQDDVQRSAATPGATAPSEILKT